MKVNGGATEAIKPLLGNYYQYDGTPILKAMYREMKECIYVEKDEEVNNMVKMEFDYVISRIRVHEPKCRFMGSKVMGDVGNRLAGNHRLAASEKFEPISRLIYRLFAKSDNKD
ncbi:hypothetical protein AgCh_000987 [Apium graveolens]